MEIIIVVKKKAQKYLEKVDKKISDKLMEAIDKLPEGDIVKLNRREGYRLRVGDLRILFTIEGNTITITKIAPRGDVYLNGIII